MYVNVNSWIKFKLYTVWQFFYASLGRSLCQGNEHHGIDPNISKQVGFRPSWLFHKGCFSLHSWWDAMLARNGTCWVCDLLAFSLLQLSFNIHSSNGFSCPIKFFHLKIAIGLALGESWLLLVQPQKNTDVQCLPFPISVGRLSLANLQKSLRRNKDVNSWIKFRL